MLIFGGFQYNSSSFLVDSRSPRAGSLFSIDFQQTMVDYGTIQFDSLRYLTFAVALTLEVFYAPVAIPTPRPACWCWLAPAHPIHHSHPSSDESTLLDQSHTSTPRFGPVPVIAIDLLLPQWLVEPPGMPGRLPQYLKPLPQHVLRQRRQTK